MALWMLRGLFLAIAFGAGISMVTRPGEVQNEYTYATMLIIGAVGLVAVDVLIRRKSIEVISCVYFGIAIGMFLGFVYLYRNNKESLFLTFKDTHQSNLDDIKEQEKLRKSEDTK